MDTLAPADVGPAAFSATAARADRLPIAATTLSIGGAHDRFGGSVVLAGLVLDSARPARLAAFGGGGAFGIGMVVNDDGTGIGVQLVGGPPRPARRFVADIVDGDVGDILGGANYQVNDRFLDDVTIGYEVSDFDAAFDQRPGDLDTFTVAPFARYVLNRYFLVDVQGGYTFAEHVGMREAGSGWSDVPAHASHWFVAGNLEGSYTVDRFTVGGRVGYAYPASDYIGEMTSRLPVGLGRGSDVGQFRIGASLGYQIDNIEPYVTGSYVQEAYWANFMMAPLHPVAWLARDDIDVGGGVRITLGDSVTAAVAGAARLGREDFQSTSLTGYLRIKF